MKNLKTQIFIGLLFIGSLLNAQNSGKQNASSSQSNGFSKSGYHPITVNFGLGSTSYYGQLSSTEHSFKAMNYQLNIGAKYRISPRFCAGGFLRHAVFSASDTKTDSPIENGGAGRYERGLNFRTNTFALEAYGTFDIFAFKRNHIVEGEIVGGGGIFGISPYLIAGVGLMYYNPTSEVNGEVYSVRNAKTSLEKQNGLTYSIFTPVVSYGAGARVQLTRLLDLGMDVTFNNTFTDYLDNTGSNTHYPDRTRADITVIDLAIADRYPAQGLPERTSTDIISNSGGRILDSYFMLNLKLEFTIPGKQDMIEANKLKTSHKHLKKGKGAKHHKFDER